jgi:hypothetical protein
VLKKNQVGASGFKAMSEGNNASKKNDDKTGEACTNLEEEKNARQRLQQRRWARDKCIDEAEAQELIYRFKN